MLTLFFAVAALFSGPVWTSPGQRVIGQHGDPEEYLWFVKWFQFSVFHGYNPFFSNYVNYPKGVNLMWNTSNPALAFLASPVTAAFGPIVSYNALITAAIALSGWCAYLCCRRYTGSLPASLIGGLVFAFSPYILHHANQHLSLAFAVYPPLLLLTLDDILVRQRRRPVVAGALLGALAAFQYLVSEESLVLGALVAFAGLVLLLLFHPHVNAARLTYAARAGAVSLLAFAALAEIPIWQQFAGPRHPRLGGLFHPRNEFVTDGMNLVVPTDTQLLAPRAAVEASMRWTGNISEFAGYIGLPLLLLVVWLVVTRWREPIVRLLGLLALVATILSLGPHLHLNGKDSGLLLPWALLDGVRLINNALPARLMVFTDLCLAVLIALFAASLLREAAWQRRLLGGGTLIVVLLTLLPAWPSRYHTVDTPRFFTSEEARAVIRPGATVLVAPFANQDFPDPMVWQSFADLRFRMPEGYFIGTNDAGEPTVGSELTALTTAMSSIQGNGRPVDLSPDARAEMLRELSDRQIDAVIVGPMPHQDEMLRLFGSLLRREPEYRDGVYIWRRSGR